MYIGDLYSTVTLMLYIYMIYTICMTFCRSWGARRIKFDPVRVQQLRENVSWQWYSLVIQWAMESHLFIHVFP